MAKSTSTSQLPVAILSARSTPMLDAPPSLLATPADSMSATATCQVERPASRQQVSLYQIVAVTAKITLSYKRESTLRTLFGGGVGTGAVTVVTSLFASKSALLASEVDGRHSWSRWNIMASRRELCE